MHLRRPCLALVSLGAWGVLAAAQGGVALAAEIAVASAEALGSALRAASPGDVIRVAPGTYRGGFGLEGFGGTREKPLVIAAADPSNPPVFSARLGGSTAFHLSGCSHVTLRNLKVVGFPANGINADDGGRTGDPRSATGLVFEGLVIEDTGPTGNHDGLKLSGLGAVLVKGCRFAGWGGSAIDLVGCHDVVVDGCRFEGKEGFSQDNGIQIKGGSRGVLVRRSFFRRAGQRAINLGGSTGLPYFRPPDAAWEARDVEVAENRFVGSLAPIAWVGSDGGHVHHNLFYLPEKWVVRILQENTDPRFGRCRAGRFEQNLVVFDRRVRVFANVGPGTEAETFSFRGNAWFCVDEPARGPTGLPGAVEEGLTGRDPELRRTGEPDMAIGSDDPRFHGIGPSEDPPG